MKNICKSASQTSSNNNIINMFTQIPKITKRNITRRISKEDRKRNKEKEIENENVKYIKDMISKISKLEKEHNDQSTKDNITDIKTYLQSTDLLKLDEQEITEIKNILKKILSKIEKKDTIKTSGGSTIQKQKQKNN